MNSSNFYNKTPNKSLSCITKNPILNQNQGNLQTQKQPIQNFNSFDQQQLISERQEFNSKIFNLRNQNNSDKFSLQDSQNSLILSQFSHRNDYKFTSSMSPLKKNHIKNLELESSLNQNQNQQQKQKNKILNANLEPMQNNHLPYIDAFISKTPKHQNIKFQKINEHNSEIHLQKQFKNDESPQSKKNNNNNSNINQFYNKNLQQEQLLYKGQNSLIIQNLNKIQKSNENQSQAQNQTTNQNQIQNLNLNSNQNQNSNLNNEEQPVQIKFIKNQDNEYQLTQNSVKNQIHSPLKKINQSKTGSQTNILQLKQSPKNLHSINQSENFSNIQNIPLILKQSKKSIKPKYQFSDSNLQLSPNSHEKTQHTQPQKLNNLQSPTSISNQQFKNFISNISSSNQQTDTSSLLSKNLQNQQQRNSSLDTIKNSILSQKRQQIPQFNNFSKRKSMKNLTYKQEKIDLLILLKRLTAHYNSTEQKLTQKLSQIIFQILSLLSQEQDNKYGNDMLIFFQIINQMIFCQNTEIINLSQNKQNEQQEILPYFQSNLLIFEKYQNLNKQSQEELQKKDEKYQKLYKNFKKLENQNQELIQQLNSTEKQDKIDQLNEEIKYSNKMILQSQKQIEDLKFNIGKLEDQIISIKSKKKQYKLENKTNLKNLQQQTKNVKELEQNLSKNQEELQQQKQIYEQLEDENQKLKQQINEKQQTISDNDKQLIQLQNQNQQLKNEIEELNCQSPKKKSIQQPIRKRQSKQLSRIFTSSNLDKEIVSPVKRISSINIKPKPKHKNSILEEI